MSSYKRIPKSLVKKTEQVISINDRYQGAAPGYVQHVTEDALSQAKEVVYAKEKEMLHELEMKKEAMIEASYQEGFQRAKDEVREEIRKEEEALLMKANEIYMEANRYHQKLVEESEQMKLNYLIKNREDILEIVLALSEKLMQQEFEQHPEHLNHLLDQVVERIPYESKRIFIRIHPKAKRQLAAHVLDERMELLPDSTLDFYDFIVETDREFIDARIETTLNQMKSILRGVLHD